MLRVKRNIADILVFLGLGAKPERRTEPVLDYDKMIVLDAERLAETGIKEVYEEIKPTLQLYVSEPAEIIEIDGSELAKYSVLCAGITYAIYSPTLLDTEGESWGRATHALEPVEKLFIPI
ncbi:MAG: hypothetical protein Q3M24_15965 [Candidatus Electrothrix aestuarii]|uniref:Uncharacterized protein n=1 Tax=Candidatus Electrothrix aestuarii TaxID=3062594 RepID=A0AAU8LSF0_9BACT